MATYNLDETPDVFITPAFYDDKFKYRMQQFKGEQERETIRNIDLSSDKVIIYGCEIKESVLERLYESLVIRPKLGVVYVNCDGACYFVVAGKGCYRPIRNVIFDWSQFGITVPNTVHDSLRKQLVEKEAEILVMNHQLSSSRDDLEASRKEVEELKEQLSTSKKNQQEMEAKLEKVTNSELELSRKRIRELEEQVTSLKKEKRNMDEQLYVIDFELKHTKSQLKSSDKTIQELEDQVSACRKECDDTKMELSSKEVEFEERLSICMKERKDMEVELQKMEEQVSWTKHELHSTITQFSSIDSEVKHANQKLDQLLMSILWSGFEDSCHPIRLKQNRGYADSLLQLKEFDNSILNIPITQEVRIQ